MVAVQQQPELGSDWRSWPPEAKARLRWRLLTDRHPDPAHRRPDQLTPGEHVLCNKDPQGFCLLHKPWDAWFLLGGRGSGKTRAGAEDVAHFALTNPGVRVALVAATFGDVRDTMIEGESGLLAVIPEECLRGGTRDTGYNRTTQELHLANGSRFDGYSSETPERLRGPQHHRAWADELAAWKDAHLGDVLDTTMNNLMMGLRLGEDPKLIVTTTPKNNKLVKELMFANADEPDPSKRVPNPTTVISRFSTYANVHNLAAAFKRRILAKYEGTTTGRQELHAELVEDVEGALWTQALINKHRVSKEPDLSLVAISVDPAVTSNDDSDDTGVVIVGKSRRGCPWCGTREDHAFVLEDRTCHLDPGGWAEVVVGAFDDFDADAVIGEVNNGGDLVESNIHTVRKNLPVKKVRASRGKKVRAQPVAALYQQGKVHHVGYHPLLESQQTTWNPDESKDSPDRVDALVWGVWYLMLEAEEKIEVTPSGIRGAARASGWR